MGEAGAVAQALLGFRLLQPDVAVLDVRLPDGNGIELCRDVFHRSRSAVPMLTSFTYDEAMLDAILAGANGYVVKDIKGMELAQAIKEVGAGKSLLDNRAAAALMTKLSGATAKSDPLSGLTDQERVLLDLLGDGLTNRQIAAQMFLAEKTVELRVSIAGQTRHGAADSGRSLRIQVGSRTPRGQRRTVGRAVAATAVDRYGAARPFGHCARLCCALQ